MHAVWFHDHGVHVFPVHGKEPAVPKGSSWKDWRGDVARLRNYAVALSAALGVLDTDNRDDELWVLQQIAHRVIPDTPLLVETARGFHRYYRLAGPLPKFLHRDGHTLEFRNEGQYVVGPGSAHPSGTTYTALYWSWRWEDIPFFQADFVFDDRPLAASSDGQPLTLPEIINEKERHETLHKLMRSLAAHGVPLEGALKTCAAANLAKCRPPLEANENLDRFLRRAYQQRDRADFVRAPKRGWDLAGSLLDVGLPIDAVLVAVRSIDPTFDPETSE
jgi:Bifunctional DNA primase/polymerase, N-terminal